MIKIISMLLPLVVIVSCENSLMISSGASAIGGIDASKICAGEVVSGVTGTAICSPSGASEAVGFYVLSSRLDSLSVGDWSDSQFLAELVDGTINRSESVLTLNQLYTSTDLLSLFKTKYQTVPNPVTDSDGRYADNGAIEKQHYLERITGRPDQECGTSGTITQRIADCSSKNTVKAYYNSRQYGQMSEGDWRLVTRLASGDEIWRDERTKLLWSDKSYSQYNWYLAAGYSKPSSVSYSETGFDSRPGSANDCWGWNCQDANPSSICAEVDDNGMIIGGGAEPTIDGSYIPTSDSSIEKTFKGNLSAADNVIWKLPSLDDWKLADINGLRKVLPYMDYEFWTSTSNSGWRRGAILYKGNDGSFRTHDRRNGDSYVRCVGFVRD